MPFDEALFWFGITVVTAGIFILWERYIKSWWISLVLVVAGLGAMGYSIYVHNHPEAPNPPVWVLLFILTWFVLGYVLLRRRRVGTPLSDTVIQKIEKAGKLHSLAGESDWLADKLVDTWHLFNSCGQRLNHPIAKGVIPDKIESETDKQLWMFRVWYQSLLGSMKVIDPECDSTLMKDGFPAQRQYMEVERNIREHAGVLRTRAKDLLASARKEHEK